MMILHAFEDELKKVAARAVGAVQFLRNQAPRRKWLKGNARERFIKSRTTTGKSETAKYYAKKNRELDKLKNEAPRKSQGPKSL